MSRTAGYTPLGMWAARITHGPSSESAAGSVVVAEKALHDGGRTITVLEFDGGLGLELDPTVDRFDLDEANPPSNPTSDRYRSDESDPIDSVVDNHPDTLLIRLHDRSGQRPHQRKSQESVNDRPAKGAVIGLRSCPMDPLVIVGGVGEGVHAILFDPEPVADSELGADECGEVDHKRLRIGPATCS